MNRKQLFTAAALTLLGSAAMAQTAVQEENEAFRVDTTTNTTRAEVRSELLRARAAGEVPMNTEGMLADRQQAAMNAIADQPAVAPLADSTQPRTRAEVRAETIAWMRGEHVR